MENHDKRSFENEENWILIYYFILIFYIFIIYFYYYLLNNICLEKYK